MRAAPARQTLVIPHGLFFALLGSSAGSQVRGADDGNCRTGFELGAYVVENKSFRACKIFWLSLIGEALGVEH